MDYSSYLVPELEFDSFSSSNSSGSPESYSGQEDPYSNALGLETPWSTTTAPASLLGSPYEDHPLVKSEPMDECMSVVEALPPSMLFSPSPVVEPSVSAPAPAPLTPAAMDASPPPSKRKRSHSPAPSSSSSGSGCGSASRRSHSSAHTSPSPSTPTPTLSQPKPKNPPATNIPKIQKTSHSSTFVPPDTSNLSKREARLLKNRAAAFLSRQRKREAFEQLEERVGELEKENARLTHELEDARGEVWEARRREGQLRVELASLRARLEGAAASGAPAQQQDAQPTQGEEDAAEKGVRRGRPASARIRERAEAASHSDRKDGNAKSAGGVALMVILFSFALFGLPSSRSSGMLDRLREAEPSLSDLSRVLSSSALANSSLTLDTSSPAIWTPPSSDPSEAFFRRLSTASSSGACGAPFAADEHAFPAADDALTKLLGQICLSPAALQPIADADAPPPAARWRETYEFGRGKQAGVLVVDGHAHAREQREQSDSASDSLSENGWEVLPGLSVEEHILPNEFELSLAPPPASEPESPKEMMTLTLLTPAPSPPASAPASVGQTATDEEEDRFLKLSFDVSVRGRMTEVWGRGQVRGFLGGKA